MAQSDLDICNAAILRVGGEPLDALDEDTPLGAFCLIAYPQKRRWLLGKHRWTFAAATAQLARRQVTPTDCPELYAFDLPPDIVGAVAGYRADAWGGCAPGLTGGAGGRLVNGYVASASLSLWIEYTRLAPEASWPVWFEELAVVAFASDVGAFVQNQPLSRALYQAAFGTPDQAGEGGLLLAAKVEDGRNAPQRSLDVEFWDPGPLVTARFGGTFENRLVWQAGRYGLTFIDFAADGTPVGGTPAPSPTPIVSPVPGSGTP